MMRPLTHAFSSDLRRCSIKFVAFQLTGQPVLIGGTMGTCSYVLTGTQHGMETTFGTTCHGAVSSAEIRVNHAKQKIMVNKKMYSTSIVQH